MMNGMNAKILNHFNGLSEDDLTLALQTERNIPPQVLAVLFTRASVNLKSKKIAIENDFGKMPGLNTRLIFNTRRAEIARRRQKQKEEDKSMCSGSMMFFCYMAAVDAFNTFVDQAAAEDCCLKEEEEDTSALKADFGAASSHDTSAMVKALAALTVLQSRSAALLQNGMQLTKNALPGFAALIAA